MRSSAGIILLTGLAATAVSCTALNTATVSHDGVPYYLPHTLLKLTFDPSGASPTITAEPNDVADPLQRYIAYYAPNAFAQDRLCVSRSTTTGLLSRVWFSAQDQTEQVLLNVVQIAANFAAPAAPAQAASLRARSQPSAPVTMTIDPSDPAQLSALNRKLGRYRIAVPETLVSAAPFQCPQNSVCFGTRISVPIRLYDGGQLVDQKTVTMVDPNGYGSIDISRAFMTARITKVDFDNGVMTNLRVSKDSEALAASEFPLKAIERILAVPGNGFALAVGTFQEKQAYLSNRQTLQNALGSGAGQASSSDLKLIDADSCLDQKQQQSASANPLPSVNSASANQSPGGSGVSGPPPRLSK